MGPAPPVVTLSYSARKSPPPVVAHTYAQTNAALAFADRRDAKISVFTGPIYFPNEFDVTPDVHVESARLKNQDGVPQSAVIPTEFYKVVVWHGQGRLRAMAFWASQWDPIRRLMRRLRDADALPFDPRVDLDSVPAEIVDERAWLESWEGLAGSQLSGDTGSLGEVKVSQVSVSATATQAAHMYDIPQARPFAP